MVEIVLRPFERSDFVRLFDFNEAAIRCYEKCGFVKERLLRDARRVGNEYWSLYIMSILETEWGRSGRRG
jgi:RimJ/RimL family protein N-acetyltransferase